MSRKNDYRGKAPFSKLTAAAVEREAGSASLIRLGFNLSDGRTIEVEKMEKDYGEWVYVTTKEGLFHTTYRDLCFFMQDSQDR